ncbi:zinc finger protein 239-like [Mya arenaria]|nr:zinc finger protein 239-like [Mya arenaria]
MNKLAFRQKTVPHDTQPCVSEDTIKDIEEDEESNPSYEERIKKKDVNCIGIGEDIDHNTEYDSDSTISFNSDDSSGFSSILAQQNINQQETDEHTSSSASNDKPKKRKSLKSNQSAESKESKIGDYQCSECNKKYTILKRFQAHKCVWRCEICQKGFKMKCYYMMHRKRHDKEKDHKCNVCEKSYFEKSDLIDHMRKHEGKKEYICDFCGKEYSQRKLLYVHRYYKHVNPRAEGEFKCDHPQCGKSFKFLHHLQGHKSAFHRKKTFLCVQCGKAFKNRQKLQVHSFAHTDQKPFDCLHEGCGKSFKSERALKNHSKRHNSEERKHVCDKCGKAFFDRRALEYHTRTHTGEKPCVCTICDYRCTHPPNLKKHMKIHEKSN